MTSTCVTINPLIGIWKLIAYENFQASGDSILITDGQQGLLEYTKDGKVRLSIQRGKDKLKSLGLDSRYANIRYSGRYEIDAISGVVFHHIKEANESGRVGKTLTRHYLLTDNYLEITGIGLDGKVKLTWARALS